MELSFMVGNCGLVDIVHLRQSHPRFVNDTTFFFNVKTIKLTQDIIFIF